MGSNEECGGPLGRLWVNWEVLQYPQETPKPTWATMGSLMPQSSSPNGFREQLLSLTDPHWVLGGTGSYWDHVGSQLKTHWDQMEDAGTVLGVLGPELGQLGSCRRGQLGTMLGSYWERLEPHWGQPGSYWE